MSETESIISRLLAKYPDRNVVFTAIETIKNPHLMRKFMDEYVQWLKERNPDNETFQQNPSAVACSNIGYAVGYYTQETAKQWFGAIEGLSHPVFGKNIPFDQSEIAYKAGREYIIREMT